MPQPYNPLPGPQPYTSADRAVFFGREAMTLRLGDAVLSQRVLTVFGPSGAGKSSLLRAGVVPYLVEGWDLRPVIVDAWPPERILSAGPVQRLAEGIAEALELGEVCTDLGRALGLAARRSDRPVLLVLDQLEQLLVHHELPVLHSFIAALDQMFQTAWLGLHVVLSLREDYLGRWTALLRHSPSLIRHTFRVPRLSVADMTSAVTRAAALGVPPQTWRRELLAPLISAMSLEGEWRSDEAEVESAYVQIVCRALWEQGGPREGETQSPKEILERYLDDTLRGLGALEAPARHLLEDRLITRSGARIPITRAAALEELPTPEDLDRVLGTLEAARILRAQEHHGDRFFELGHDWLARPIQESAASRRRREATRAARRRRLVQTGVLVLAIMISAAFFSLYLEAEASRVAAVTSGELARAERERAERERAQAVQQRQVAEDAKMSALEEKRLAEEARRRAEEAERDALTARGSALSASLAAMEAAQRAREQKEVARSQARRALDTLHMLAVRDLSGDPTRAAPFLREVSDPAAYPRWSVELLHTLQRPLATVEWDDRAGDAPTDLRFSPDGVLVALGYASGAVHVRDAATGARSQAFEGHTRPVRALRWSPDGARLASASEDGTGRIWSLRSGDAVTLRHPGRVWSLAWSPDGRHMATACEDGAARIWPAEGGAPSATLRHGGPVWSVAWSPRGDALVTASADGTARRWSAEGQELASSQVDRAVFQAAWLPDGGRVLFGAADRQSWLWLEGAREAAAAVLQGGDFVVQIATSPDGRVAASRTRSGVASAWTVPRAEEQLARVWPLASGRVGLLQLGGAGGRLLAQAVRGGPAEVWRLGYEGRPDRRWILEGQDDVLVLDLFGDRVATASSDGTGRIWSIQDDGLSRVIEGLDGSQVRALAFSADGSAAWVRYDDGAERSVALSPGGSAPDPRWSSATEARALGGDVTAVVREHGRIDLELYGLADTPVTLDEHAGAVRVLALRADGGALLSASDDGTVRLWSLPTVDGGKALLSARTHDCISADDRERFLGDSPEQAVSDEAACLAERLGASR